MQTRVAGERSREQLAEAKARAGVLDWSMQVQASAARDRLMQSTPQRLDGLNRLHSFEADRKIRPTLSWHRHSSSSKLRRKRCANAGGKNQNGNLKLLLRHCMLQKRGD